MSDEASNPQVPVGDVSTQVAIAFYQATAQHWAHAEQVRWSLVANYSVASSVLLLAWAEVFGASVSTGKAVVLATLAAAGLPLTLLWLVLQVRANGFVHRYAQTGTAAELDLNPQTRGPFREIQDYRRSIGIIRRRLGTRVLAPAVLVIFVLVYFVLLALSLGWVGGGPGATGASRGAWLNAAVLNRIGLAAGMIGAVVLYVRGPVQPVLEEGVAVGLEDGNRLPSGETVGEHNQRVRRLERQYKRWSQFGLALVGIGFATQFAAALLR